MENPNIIPKPLLPLYLVHWIFGLGIFEFPLGTLHPNLSIIYSSILIFTYYTMVAFTYPELYKLFSKKGAIIPVIILAISQNLLTLVNIIFSFIKCKVSTQYKYILSFCFCIINYIKNDVLLKIFGILFQGFRKK